MPNFRPLDAMRAIRDLRDLSATQKVSAPQKAVLYALTLRADDDGACWPSYGTIANDAGLSTRAAKENVAALQKAGHITITKRQTPGRLESDSNLYVVHVLHQVVQEEHQVVRQVHDVVQDVHDGGAPDAPRVVQEVHQGSAPDALYLPIELPNGSAHGSPAPARATEKPAKKVRRKPKTHPPASDATDADVDAWCARWSLPSPRKWPEVAKMINHFLGTGEPKADWLATWKNWEQRAEEFAARPGVVRRIPGGQPVDLNAPWLREGT